MKTDILLAFFLVFALHVPASVAADVNFTQCLQDFQNGLYPDQLSAGRNSHGQVVANFTDATALSYRFCTEHCEIGPSPISWRSFSEQFGAWLLPWLALLSQLPFSAHDLVDDVSSIALTVGSPMLAAYSLAISVMNHRWLTQLFAEYHKGGDKQHVKNVVEVLGRLQQCPVNFLKREQLKTTNSLNNHAWWEDMLEKLKLDHTWSISAAISIGWVITAFLFTIVDSTLLSKTGLYFAGQGVGYIWLWLLTIVVGWLQFSQKTTAERMAKAAQGERPDELQPFRFRPRSAHNRLRRDEHRIPPVYNYSRVFLWTENVLKVVSILKEALLEHRRHRGDRATSGSISTVSFANDPTDAPNDQRLAHNKGPNSVYPKVTSIWESGVLNRIFVSSFFASVLQWGTVGSSIVISFFSPTVGLSCRSFSFILYGAISTVIWLMFIASSFLTYVAVRHSKKHRLEEHELVRVQGADSDGYASEYEDEDDEDVIKKLLKEDTWYWLTTKSAIALRSIAMLLAWVNAAWIVAICILEFLGFFFRCYCMSCVLGLGERYGYAVIQYTDDDQNATMRAWIGGLGLGLSTSCIFGMFIALQLNPPLGY